MPHRNRALLAITAMLGLVLSTFAVASPASAGGEESADLAHTSTQLSGTASNGVEWTADRSPFIGAGQTVTFTFSEPVTVRFAVEGLNCAGESIRVPDDAELDELNPTHTWNAATHVIATNGTGTGAEKSTFTLDEPVTSYSLTGVGASGCIRGVREQSISVFRNETPTASIAAPIDGGVFSQGQTLPADYSCADADTAHVDAVTCLGDVADGGPIDTSTVGNHTFTVTATDEHGATSSETVNYTVKDQTGLCSGTALGLPLNLNIATANPGAVPCATREGNILKYTLPLGTLPFPLTALSPTLSLNVLEATSEKDGNVHRASAMVDDVRIAFPLNAWSLELKDLWSEVEASTPVNCAAGNDLKGTAEIGRIIRNGTIVHNQLSKPLTIPLPLLGGVHFNQVAKTGKQVSANAVFIDLPGGLLDVNIGSSVAGVDC